MRNATKGQFDDVLDAIEPVSKIDMKSEQKDLERAFDILYWHGKHMMLEKGDDGAYHYCSGGYETSFRTESPLEGKVLDFQFDMILNAYPRYFFEGKYSNIRMNCFIEDLENGEKVKLTELDYTIRSRASDENSIASRVLCGDLNRMYINSDFTIAGGCDVEKYSVSIRRVLSLLNKGMDKKHAESYRKTYDIITMIPELVNKRILNR